MHKRFDFVNSICKDRYVVDIVDDNHARLSEYARFSFYCLQPPTQQMYKSVLDFILWRHLRDYKASRWPSSLSFLVLSL